MIEEGATRNGCSFFDMLCAVCLLLKTVCYSLFKGTNHPEIRLYFFVNPFHFCPKMLIFSANRVIYIWGIYQN